jgi:hypothetical protein
VIARYDVNVRFWVRVPHMHILFSLEFLNDFSRSTVANPYRSTSVCSWSMDRALPILIFSEKNVDFFLVIWLVIIFLILNPLEFGHITSLDYLIMYHFIFEITSKGGWYRIKYSLPLQICTNWVFSSINKTFSNMYVLHCHPFANYFLVKYTNYSCILIFYLITNKNTVIY